ncbi:UDP-N-acetylmuramate--L-alanine ligase [Frigoribacterium faeni]|uniref:UDP-N-acetylmuramate--L-alanine ligase n=1 Tax=Frigoribacterium faeni TaxID=145483 RepID=A0A7W3PI37_9MICO|nr:UDP-N-acetylmuramate--L-alanine ligase [Frigoribacterium faeni]MBA8813000.1 UDP-N-acetylmuramate--alanine ligase [Frigoribacterium faeni]BFF14173.1 UDP-N-acetylmuramate--L-alanine ligase [Microbacterium flavescens]GEK82039.1 UDP-N-acetylmuramate--L-alanine ligase [Frigoribacterium faeni]
MIKPDLTQQIPAELGRLHFVGIGGAGMSGIARVFLDAGHIVTGSDIRDTPGVQALRDLGAVVSIGHDAANLGEADTLVVTGALWQDNPEYQAALAKGIPVLHRSQALAWLIGEQRLVSVAGAHGKTTSTGMIVTALLASGHDPSFVNGGVIQSLGVSARGGSDDLVVVEADESDGSFLLYDTSIALVTNVDADHLDHYGSHEAFDEAFVTFSAAASELVVISSDDPGARRVAAALDHPRVVTFGLDAEADVRLSDVASSGPVSFTLHRGSESWPVQLRVPGRHNAVNAAGAFAVLLGLGVDPQAAIAGLETFGGTERRFELHGTVAGVSVYDDYAHHPTEVAAALQAARSVVGEGRLIAVHQPHLYSRTRLMAGDFAETYESLADHTIVLDVYGAREDPEPGVTGALVSERFADPSRVDFVADWQEAAERTAAVARAGDFVITLGCGDVYRIVPQLLGALDAAAAPVDPVSEETEA